MYLWGAVALLGGWFKFVALVMLSFSRRSLRAPTDPENRPPTNVGGKNDAMKPVGVVAKVNSTFTPTHASPSHLTGRVCPLPADCALGLFLTPFEEGAANERP